MTVRDLIILGCSSQHPTRRRNQGAYLLRWNGEGLLFDPGEGTQRQFIFADVAPTTVTRILISHFHGDHCLGLGSMLMRLNLDKVNHPIHCYYPASGKKYFDRLRYGTIYKENIRVIEHPIEKAGVVHRDDNFIIETEFLQHGVDNVAYRITEPDQRKFEKDKIKKLKINGIEMKEILEKGSITKEGRLIVLDEISHLRKGDVFALVIDTRYCQNAINIAKDATMLLCESTYLEAEKELAYEYQHMTAKQAASVAQQADVHKLILTHFSARYLDLNEFELEAREVFPEAYAADDFKRFPFPKRHV